MTMVSHTPQMPLDLSWSIPNPRPGYDCFTHRLSKSARDPDTAVCTLTSVSMSGFRVRSSPRVHRVSLTSFSLVPRSPYRTHGPDTTLNRVLASIGKMHKNAARDRLSGAAMALRGCAHRHTIHGTGCGPESTIGGPKPPPLPCVVLAQHRPGRWRWASRT